MHFFNQSDIIPLIRFLGGFGSQRGGAGFGQSSRGAGFGQQGRGAGFGQQQQTNRGGFTQNRGGFGQTRGGFSQPQQRGSHGNNGASQSGSFGGHPQQIGYVQQQQQQPGVTRIFIHFNILGKF
jgi:hypothetical protein